MRNFYVLYSLFTHQPLSQQKIFNKKVLTGISRIHILKMRDNTLTQYREKMKKNIEKNLRGLLLSYNAFAILKSNPRSISLNALKTTT